MNKAICDKCEKEMEHYPLDIILSLDKNGKDSDGKMVLFIKIERMGDICKPCSIEILHEYTKKQEKQK